MTSIAAAAPAYRVTNEGEQVQVEILQDPSIPEPPLSAVDRVTDRTPLLEVIRLRRESFSPEEQAQLLEIIARRRPGSVAELRALMDLFLRDDRSARAAAEASVRRLDPERDARFGPFFVGLMDDVDPKFRLFGLVGADRLRPPEALASLLRDAKEPFEIAKPSLRTAPRPANEWLYRFEALRVLADWKGEEVLSLLIKRAEEAPDVAKLAAHSCWKAFLPKLLKWSRSKDRDDQLRADAGWRAPVPVQTLRETVDTLWKVLESRRYDRAVRHQAAIKLGLSADDAAVDRLLELRGKTRKDEDKRLYEAAIFASRHDKAIPLLEEYVRGAPSAEARAGALTQLSDMVSPERYRGLLKEMADSDPDPDNRARARKTLELSSR